MIDEVKKIKLEELNNQKVQYEGKENTIKQRLYTIGSKLCKLEWEQSNGITIIDNFSFLEKWITRRNAYKKFKAQSKRFSKLSKLIRKVKSELDEEYEKVEHELESSGINAKLKEIRQKMSLIEDARTLYEIGITPTDAMELLESKGIQPVLSESDKCVFLHPRDYSSKSSLIGVHKTRYAPTANMIKSAKDSNVEYKKNITINGVEYEYSFKSARDTVHMAMNDEVSSHMYGSWDDCKYAVLIPFDDIPDEKIGRAAPMDTFTRGSIELSEHTWILCPKNEVERLKIFNPKTHVLGYEGENVQGFSQPFLTQLGYRAEDVDMWNWSNDESAHQFYELMAREGIKTGTHTYTYFHEDEQLLARINQAVSLSKLLRDNHLITTPEDIENIMNQLADNYQSFGFILSDLGEKTSMGSDVEPQSIKGNKKQVNIFLEEMKKNGFNISPAYQDIMKKLCVISIFDCNENCRDVINIPDETSDEERKTIEELQAVLASNKYIGVNEKKSAFGKFISTAICESILYSQERDVLAEKSQEGR
ncbi:MAG: hypothetical protein J6J36_04595 [Clostridia bacterium]|nr:hypothetical protein [Clostridia bacterium]